MKVITSVRHKEWISFKELSHIRTIPQSSGKIIEKVASVICFLVTACMPLNELEPYYGVLRGRGTNIGLVFYVHHPVMNLILVSMFMMQNAETCKRVRCSHTS